MNPYEQIHQLLVKQLHLERYQNPIYQSLKRQLHVECYQTKDYLFDKVKKEVLKQVDPVVEHRVFEYVDLATAACIFPVRHQAFEDQDT